MEIGLRWLGWVREPCHRVGVSGPGQGIALLEKRGLQQACEDQQVRSKGHWSDREAAARGGMVPSQATLQARGRAGTRLPIAAGVENPPQPWPTGGWSLSTDRGLFQAVEVDVQVGIDAVGGAGQCDAMDQEHKQHEVRQRGRDPHNLAVEKLAVRAQLCPWPGGAAGAQALSQEPGTPSLHLTSRSAHAKSPISRPWCSRTENRHWLHPQQLGVQGPKHTWEQRCRRS